MPPQQATLFSCPNCGLYLAPLPARLASPEQMHGTSNCMQLHGNGDCQYCRPRIPAGTPSNFLNQHPVNQAQDQRQSRVRFADANSPTIPPTRIGQFHPSQTLNTTATATSIHKSRSQDDTDRDVSDFSLSSDEVSDDDEDTSFIDVNVVRGIVKREGAVPENVIHDSDSEGAVYEMGASASTRRGRRRSGAVERGKTEGRQEGVGGKMEGREVETLTLARFDSGRELGGASSGSARKDLRGMENGMMGDGGDDADDEREDVRRPTKRARRFSQLPTFLIPTPPEWAEVWSIGM